MTIPNFDTMLDRLAERQTRGVMDYCDNCHAGLTEIDFENGECTACHSSLESDDKSADEHLWNDDDEFDYHNDWKEL